MNAPLEVVLSKVFSYSLIHDAIAKTIPILYAAMCAIISRQVDITNIAAEGIIMFSAFFGIMVSYWTHSWVLAVLTGIAIGVFISALMAGAYLKYNVNIFVLGLCINLIGSSGTRFLLQILTGSAGNFSDPSVVPIPRLELPFLENNKVLYDIFSGYCVTELMAIPVVIFIWYMLYKTVWGLRLRSVGLNEMAAITAGIDVKQKKFQALVLSGACAGLAGVHMSLGFSRLFIENMSGGKGFMGMAAMQFGGGNPLYAAVGCLFFGVSGTVADRLGPWGIPSQFVNMLPYIATVLILAISVIVQQANDRKAASAIEKKKK